jgi:hypothetical protein
LDEERRRREWRGALIGKRFLALANLWLYIKICLMGTKIEMDGGLNQCDVRQNITQVGGTHYFTQLTDENA